MRFNFLSSQRGSMTVIAALSIGCVMIGVGMVVDYGRAVNAYRAALAAADSAVLAGTREAADYRNNYPLDTSGWKKVATDAATRFFASNITHIHDATITTPVISTHDKNLALSVDLKFNTDVPTYFMSFIGKRKISMTGRATAQVDLNTYIRINFLVDNSASMGIGATATDQQTLRDTTGCAVTCHYNDIWGTKDNLTMARASGATLRIDVARDAIATIIDTLKTRVNVPNQIEIGLYTFSSSLTVVDAGTTDLDLAISNAKAIEITNGDYQGGSNFDYSVKQFQAGVPMGGDGSSTNKRRVITVIITDGVSNSSQNYYVNATQTAYQRDPNVTYETPRYDDVPELTLQPFKSSYCDALKEANHEIITLELQYLIPDKTGLDNNQLNRFNWVENVAAPYITSGMQDCATSPNMAWSANSPAEIMAAANKIEQTISRPNLMVRLTK